VARPTRQARRERRQQARAEGGNGAPPRNLPPAAVASTPGGGGAGAQPVPEAAPRRRGGVFNFIVECWAELKKVEWPSQRQVMTGTVVVIIACTIVGTYLWGVDLALKPFVERLLLGQK
jgi:preprotein translocase SecE subunit